MKHLECVNVETKPRLVIIEDSEKKWRFFWGGQKNVPKLAIVTLSIIKKSCNTHFKWVNYRVCQLYYPKSTTWRGEEREVGREEGSSRILWPVFPIRIYLLMIRRSL